MDRLGAGRRAGSPLGRVASEDTHATPALLVDETGDSGESRAPPAVGPASARRLTRTPNELAVYITSAEVAGGCSEGHRRSVAVSAEGGLLRHGAEPAVATPLPRSTHQSSRTTSRRRETPDFEDKLMRSSGLEPPRENSPQGPQPRARAQDAYRSVRIVLIAGFRGRIGRIWGSDCCHDVATRRPRRRARDASGRGWLAFYSCSVLSRPDPVQPDHSRTYSDEPGLTGRPSSGWWTGRPPVNVGGARGDQLALVVTNQRTRETRATGPRGAATMRLQVRRQRT
jgi:hypothetical protein